MMNNKLIIIGNLTADPELHRVQTKDGETSVCSFTVAVNRKSREIADFFRVNAWRKPGELIAQYCRKGSKILVTGIVSCRAYTDKTGAVRASMEVDLDEFEFLDGKPAEGKPETTFTPVNDPDLPY